MSDMVPLSGKNVFQQSGNLFCTEPNTHFNKVIVVVVDTDVVETSSWYSTVFRR